MQKQMYPLPRTWMKVKKKMVKRRRPRIMISRIQWRLPVTITSSFRKIRRIRIPYRRMTNLKLKTITFMRITSSRF